MGSERQKLVAKLMVEKGRSKGISKGKILKEAGYSNAIVTHPERVFKSKGYKEAAEPLINQMKKERQRLLANMRLRDLDKQQYGDVARTFDMLTKNIQLLGGDATENTKLTITWES